MPALKPQHEAFAQAIAAGTAGTAAYAALYPRASRKTATEKASRLARNGNILARITEGTQATEPLDNARRELFAQAVASGKTPTAAYRDVYGTGSNTAKANGSRLLTFASVSARIKTLLSLSAGRMTLTRERRLEICYEVVESPTASHSARLRAVRLDAVLKGELPSRRRPTNPGQILPSALPEIIIVESGGRGRRAQPSPPSHDHGNRRTVFPGAGTS